MKAVIASTAVRRFLSDDDSTLDEYMRARDIAAGINLLLTYYDNPEGYHVGADHDQVYMSATNRALTPEDVEKMVALGWHQEHVGRGDYTEEFASKHYRPEEVWIAYV
jgi:hypothetical protein